MEPIRYAMIKNEVVENICLWNGDVFMWKPPEGILCIPAPDYIGIQWRYINGEWLEPIVPDPVPEPELDPNIIETTDEMIDPPSENLI